MPTVSAASLPYTGVPAETPQVQQPDRYQRIDARPEAFGAGVGAAEAGLGKTVEETGNVLERNAIQQQELANQVFADNASNQWQEATNKILYGDPSKPDDTGFYGKRGQDAMTAYPQVREALDKHLADTRATLQNPRQQLVFDQETRRLRAYLMNSVGAHFDKEFGAFTQEVGQAKVKNARDAQASALVSGDETEFQNQVGAAMRGRLQILSRQGLGNNEDAVNQAMTEERSIAVKQKVEILGTKNPVGALQFLENNKDALSPGEYPALQREMRSRAEKQQTYEDVYGAGGKGLRGSLADRIIGTESGGVNAKNPLSSASGPGQFLDKTWVAVVRAHAPEVAGDKSDKEILSLKGDSDLSHRMVDAYAEDNRKYLSSLGLPTDDGALYLAHFAGPEGAAKILTAKSETPIEKILPVSAINANPQIKGRTALDLRQMTAGAVGSNVPLQNAVSGDKVLGEPQVSRPLPQPDPSFLSDGVVPGLKDKIEQLDKTIPKDEPERFWRAVNEARRAFNGQYADRQRVFKEHQEQLKASSQTREDQYLRNMTRGNPNYPTTDQIKADDFLLPEAKTKMTDFIIRDQKEDPATEFSKARTIDLYAGIQLPDGNPDKVSTEKPIDDAYIAQRVTRQDHDWLIKQFRDQRTAGNETLAQKKTELRKAVESKILGPNMGGAGEFLDDERKMRLYNFVQDMDQQIDERQKGNKSVNDLFNPKSPDFLGSNENLKGKGFTSPFKATIQDPRYPPIPNAPLVPGTPQIDISSPEAIKAEVHAGRLDYDQAVDLLIKNFPQDYYKENREVPIAR